MFLKHQETGGRLHLSTMHNFCFCLKFLCEIWPSDVDMELAFKPVKFGLKILNFCKNIGKNRRGVIFLPHPVDLLEYVWI